MDVNMRRLFGSGEYLRVRRLCDSSAKSSTLINVIPTFHEEELWFCARQTCDGRVGNFVCSASFISI